MTPDPLPDLVIERLDRQQSFLDTAAGWIHEQWGSTSKEEVVQMLSNTNGIPPALVAIADGEPVGVLAFKFFELDGGENLWINAVYVVPRSRKAGVGSSLLAAAANAVRALPAEWLYVYTDVPKFYQRHEWVEHSHNEETGMTVLKLEIADVWRPD